MSISTIHKAMLVSFLAAPCFLFLFFFLLPDLKAGKYSRKTPGNETFSQRLDRLATYQIMTQSSGLLSDISRPELVDMPPDAPGLLSVGRSHLAGQSVDGHYEEISEASFAVSFTMSVYKPLERARNTNGLALIILPGPLSFWAEQFFSSNNSLSKHLGLGPNDGSLTLSNPACRTSNLAGGGGVSVEIGSIIPDLWHFCCQLPVINVTIIDPAAARYTAWIDYNRSTHHLSVYVGAGEGIPKPDKAIIIVEHANYFNNGRFFTSAYFGLFSSVGQLLKVHTWNSTVQGLRVFRRTLPLGTIQGTWLLIVSFVPFVIISVIVCPLAGYFCMSKKIPWMVEHERLLMFIKCLPGVPAQVDYADIEMATNNFSEDCNLGQGGYGAVYRCTLPAAVCGREKATDVAIKRFVRRNPNQRTQEAEEATRSEDFLAEVTIINLLRHKNIVKLVGWSYKNGEPVLIYEYMPQGSLDNHLFPKRDTGTAACKPPLPWVTRKSILRDIAAGLRYVHHEHDPMVLHRDIKPSNIMLDSNFRAYLGDFGISSTVPAGRNSVAGLGGTPGYRALEWVLDHEATCKTDIYAFGVVVLEVVTGKKWNFQLGRDGDHITDWVRSLEQEGRLNEAMDAVVFTAARSHQQHEAVDEARRLLLLGLTCTDNPSNRPSMEDVVGEIKKLALPQENHEMPMSTLDYYSESEYNTAATNMEGSSASTDDIEMAPLVPSLSGNVRAMSRSRLGSLSVDPHRRM